MKNTINDWGLTYNIDYPVSSKKKRTYERESFSVKLCSTCGLAYESRFNVYTQETTTYYHEDFPKRGLYRKECFKCT
jgi:hypothetical protein